jgi:hypothetical protein
LSVPEKPASSIKHPASIQQRQPVYVWILLALRLRIKSCKSYLQIARQQPGKGRMLELSFNNEWLDEWEKSVEQIEMICCPSIFGGTSIY